MVTDTVPDFILSGYRALRDPFITNLSTKKYILGKNALEAIPAEGAVRAATTGGGGGLLIGC